MISLLLKGVIVAVSTSTAVALIPSQMVVTAPPDRAAIEVEIGRIDFCSQAKKDHEAIGEIETGKLKQWCAN